MKYITTVGEQEFIIEVNKDGQVEIDDVLLDIDFQSLPDTPLYSLIINGQSYDIDIGENEGLYQVMLKGIIYEVKVEDERTRRLAGLKAGLGDTVGEVLIKAPMPGVIAHVFVEEGQAVTKGEVVVILESMKMQNEFKSPKDGTIKSVRIQAGDKIDQQAIMVTIS